MFRGTKLRMAFAIAATAAAALVGFGSPAQAASPSVSAALAAAPTDSVLINTLRLDLAMFYWPPTVVGGTWLPGAGANFYWQANGATRLLGIQGMQNASGFCGRVRLEYKDAAGTIVNSDDTTTQCPAGGNFANWVVDHSYTNAAVTHVDVSVWLQFGGGVWQEQASVTAWR